ncbi:MAG: hypothetical protein M1814_001618 [Vezdaea aestivalis]|nr:MAG: hypothetical protein M1814_001618 [Vezdaea aestivalis]
MSNVPFRAANFSRDGKAHILLAATGSVAAIKLPLIAATLATRPNTAIRILVSFAAASFLAGQSIEQPQITLLPLTLPNVEAVYNDADEWTKPWVRGDPILHIELRRWANILVIAPLSANSLAGIVGGFSSNLLLSVVRAWDSNGQVDGELKKIVVAPAMNTAMWGQPITKSQLNTLETEWKWFHMLRPVEKELACGDVGDGAMMDWKTIAQKVVELLEAPREEGLAVVPQLGL